MLITCTGCNSTVRAPESAYGKRVKCPKCATILNVPAGEVGPAEPASTDLSAAPLPPTPSVAPPWPTSDIDLFASAAPSPKREAVDFDAPSGTRRSDFHDDDDDEDFDDLDVRDRHAIRRQPLNGLATASMVMGIISVTMGTIGCACCGVIGASLALISGVMALIFGFMGKTPGSEGMATAGIICGAVGTACAVLGLIAAIFWLSAVGFMG